MLLTHRLGAVHWLPQMATKAIVSKNGVEGEAPQVHRIRITLTSKNVKNLEKGEPEARWSLHSTWRHGAVGAHACAAAFERQLIYACCAVYNSQCAMT